MPPVIRLTSLLVINCPDIDWKSATPNDHINRCLLNFTVEAGYYQFVDFATRSNNILDIILADDDQVVTAIAADAPIGHSDHLMVTFTLAVDPGNFHSAVSGSGSVTSTFTSRRSSLNKNKIMITICRS